MPYIKPNEMSPKRLPIDEIIMVLLKHIESDGEINYAITRLIHEVIKKRGLRYQVLNSCIGILECAKIELYRMVVAPYENKKRISNGAISNLDGLSLEDVR